jgi:FecR protein
MRERERPAGGSGARLLGALALVMLLFGAALFVFRGWLWQRPAPAGSSEAAVRLPLPPVPLPPEEGPEEATVVEVAGEVERAPSGGAWSRLTAGERVREGESIRTGKGARTNLRIGEKARLSVTEQTQVDIRALTRAVHRFQLARGRLAVDYQPEGKRLLQIEDPSSGAVAETKGARFGILSSGMTVAIATETGAVDLRAAGGEVQVGEGQGAVAIRGESPQAPQAFAALPAALLLKVAQPSSEDALCARVAGAAEPGTELFIDGEPVPLDRKRRFAVDVPRTPRSKASVLVALRDAAGRERVRTVECGAPESDSGVDGMAVRWRKKGRP